MPSSVAVAEVVASLRLQRKVLMSVLEIGAIVLWWYELALGLVVLVL